MFAPLLILYLSPETKQNLEVKNFLPLPSFLWLVATNRLRKCYWLKTKFSTSCLVVDFFTVGLFQVVPKNFLRFVSSCFKNAFLSRGILIIFVIDHRLIKNQVVPIYRPLKIRSLKTNQNFLPFQSGRNTPQFYGKWPFVRIIGIQEPAAALFSIFNLAAHVKWINVFRSEMALPRLELAFSPWKMFATATFHEG